MSSEVFEAIGGEHYRMKRWIPRNKVMSYRGNHLSMNPRAYVDIVGSPATIDWWLICSNKDSRVLSFVEGHLASIRKNVMDGFREISHNPNAIGMLLRNRDMIHIDGLSGNENEAAGDLMWDMIKGGEMPHWYNLCKNPANWAIDRIEEDDIIDWIGLNQNTNPRVKEILLANPDYIHWDILSGNRSKWAMDMLGGNPDMINWDELSGNPYGVEFLRHRMEEVNWRMLSTNSGAMELLEGNIGRVDWQGMSENDGIVDLLERHPEYVNNINDNGWRYGIAGNPAIYELDYDGMYSRCNVYKEEMMSRLAHPANAPCFGWLGWDEENVLGQAPRNHLIVKPK